MMDNIRGSDLFKISEISRPSASSAPTPAPAPAAIPAAAERYSEEEREIISLLDAQIGNRLSKKAGESGGNTDQALQSIINGKGQFVKGELSNKYTPEVLRAAIDKKLGRLQDTGNPSAHTELSKSVYIAFLTGFLRELTPKEQSRQTGRALALVPNLPNFIKPN
jgi:hypothetical protein